MKKEKPDIKISVVIPVYKAEEYISHLIESLKNQTLKELEFIFVDDLGNDRSMSIVSEWGSQDARVTVLRNEENLGEGASRNKGIKAARGMYINTVDPDDWVAPDFYELLYAKALETSADIVKGTRIKISERNHKEVKPRSRLNKEVATILAKGKPLYLGLHYEHQTIIFKRSLLDNEIEYGKSGNAADTTFLLKLCSKATSFAIQNKAYYYYLQRKGSATGEYSLKRSRNELISFEEQISYFIKSNNLDNSSYNYIGNIYNVYSTRFIHACEEGKITPEDKIKYISDLKEQLIRVPDHEKLYEFSPEMFALIELGILPVRVLYGDISIAKVQMADRMTYTLAIDKGRRKAACKKVESMLESYVKRRRKAGTPFKTIRSDLFQMGSEIKGLRGKLLFCRILKSAFIKNFTTHRKSALALLFGSRKKRL